ncbi:MAG TPA: M23 family metallopeptidase [Kofleriaceae bacterium]|nr:M23 family metallopeptidase [Kofleriaceae bacterium]
MKRISVLLAALFALPLAADAAPLPMPRLGAEIAPRFAVAHPKARLDLLLLPRGAIDELVRWQGGLRDAMRAAQNKLAALANGAGVRIPDVSVLTTEPVAHSESSGFGWRDDPFRHRARFHSGTDFRGKHGLPVVAAGDGVVVFAAWQGGYGNIIYVDHGGGVVTAYAHLQRFLVKPNDVVLAGQTIAAMGATGRATGPHLHFEVRLDGHPVDPGLAMTVAQLSREVPLAGKIAAFALAPELQADRLSAHDPPRQKPPVKPAGPQKPEHRPDRPGRVKTVKPVS